MTAWRERAAHLPPLLVLVGLAVATTWAGLRARPGALLGEIAHHPFDSAWLYAAVHEAVWRWPPSLHTELVRSPAPLDLLDTFADVGNPVVAAPLVALVGAAPPYNIAQCVLVALAGLAAYALGWTVLRDRAAALVAGALFAASGPLWFALRWGEDDVAAMWLLSAWMTLAARAAAPAGALRWRAAVAPAAFLGFVGYFNSYYFYFCAMMTIVLAVATAPRRRADFAPWLRFGLAYAVSSLLVYLPRFLLGVRPSRKGAELADAYYVRSTAHLSSMSPYYNDTSALDLGAFLVPPWVLDAVPAARSEGKLYVGGVALALAAVGLAALRARPRWLVVSGAVGFVLALGAYLVWRHALVAIGPLDVIPLPSAVLTAFVPGLHRMNHPFRFVILTFVVVAVFAGAGARWLVGRLPLATAGPAAALGVVLLGAGAVGERVVSDPSLVPMVATGPKRVPTWVWRMPGTPDGRDGLLHLPQPAQDAPWLDVLPIRYHRAMQMLTHGRPLHVYRDLPLATRALDAPALTAELARLVDDGVGLVLLDGARRDYSGWFGNPPPAGAAAALATAKANLDRCVSGASFGHDVYVYLLPDAPRCTD